MLEILAVIFTFVCVYLTTQNKVSSWPIGIIGVSLYFALFFQVGLYAEMITQAVFFIQGFYGWYNWAKIKEKPPAPITTLTTKQRAGWVGAILAFTIILWQILIHTSASIPLIDSFTTSISLVANWLLAKRKLENWWLWIFVDLIYVGMFIFKTLYWTAGLYFVFFFMAMYGLSKWKEEFYYGKYGRGYEDARLS